MVRKYDCNTINMGCVVCVYAFGGGEGGLPGGFIGKKLSITPRSSLDNVYKLDLE